MGFMWNKTVKVNCKENYKNDRRLTLVDNKFGEVRDFSISTDLLKYLLDEGFSGVENYIDKLVEKKFGEEQEKRKWKTYSFFVKKCDAPYMLNRMDSSEHVKSWEIHEDDIFQEDGMVRIDYVADKQVLIQEADGIAIEL